MKDLDEAKEAVHPVGSSGCIVGVRRPQVMVWLRLRILGDV